MQVHGDGYGYHPNGPKTHLVVKAAHVEKARELFAGTGIKVTTEGKRHLGAAIGTRSSTEEYVADKVRKWSEEIIQYSWQRLLKHNLMLPTVLTLMACQVVGPFSQEPFLTSLISYNHWRMHLIPALTGRPPCSGEERDLLALSVRLGGVGIINPVSTSQRVFEASVRLTSPLVAAIATQDQDQSVDIFKVMEVKASLTHRTAITTDDARLDVRARGFWSLAQDAYFDVRVFPPNAPSNCHLCCV